MGVMIASFDPPSDERPSLSSHCNTFDMTLLEAGTALFDPLSDILM
jgi:hypothetical protein